MGMFVESWNHIVSFYQNYIGTGYLFFVFIAALVFLFFTEKKKQVRTILVIAPIAIMVLFTCPLFKMAFDVIGLDGETYYRILWVLPMGITIAYAGVKLFEKYVLAGVAVMCALVVLCGVYVYDNANISKAENGHHLPQVVINVCDTILANEAEDIPRVWVVVPAEFIHFVRQYTDVICMPYGREAFVDRWEFHYPLEELMEAEVIQTKELTAEVRKWWTEYVVLHETKTFTEPMQDYGFELVATVNGYNIYQDIQTEQ